MSMCRLSDYGASQHFAIQSCLDGVSKRGALMVPKFINNLLQPMTSDVDPLAVMSAPGQRRAKSGI